MPDCLCAVSAGQRRGGAPGVLEADGGDEKGGMNQNPYQSSAAQPTESNAPRTHLSRRHFFWLSTSVVSVVHFFLTITLIITLFSVGMDRFDNGGEPAAWERPAKVLLNTLLFPAVLMTWLPRMPDPIEWILFLANSLLWGWCISLLISVCRRFMGRRLPE